MVSVPEGNYEKSFYYDVPLVSEAVSSDVKISLGQGFKLEGFRLLSVKNSGGYNLELSRGSFVSNGIAVEIKEPFTIDIPDAQDSYIEEGQPAVLIFGHTDNAIVNSPVTISYKHHIPGNDVTGLNPSDALIGVFYPKVNSTDVYFNASDGRDTKDWKWFPSSNGKISSFASPGKDLHAHFEELGTQWTKTTLLTADTASDVLFTVRDVITDLDWAYRVDLGHPSDDDQNHMFFCNGRLLRDGVDYIRESPGTLLVWGKDKAGDATYKENPYFSSSNGIDSTELTSGSFCSILSENISWRHETAFNGLESNVIHLPANSLDGTRDGTLDHLVFADGFLLPPTRYNVDRNEGKVEIKPHTEFETGSDSLYASRWINESIYYDDGTGNGGNNSLSSASLISHITIVGVENLVGVDAINDGSRDPSLYDFDETDSAKVTHSTTKFIGYANSNDLQLWVNGRLSHPDHMWANSSTSSFSIYPATQSTDNERQDWANERGVDKVEIGSLPMETRRDTGYASYYNITTTFSSEAFNSLTAVRFGSSGKQKERLHILIRPFSFEELTDVTSSVGRAIFNYPYNGDPLLSSGYAANSDQTGYASDPRHYSWENLENNLHVNEFFNSGGFNSNYFVTYDSLAGFTTDPEYPLSGYLMPGYDETSGKWPVKENSVFGTSLRIELMSDVPTGVGPAFQGSKEISSDGVIGDNLNANDPIGNSNTILTNESTGLYTKDVNVEDFFSDLNPIMSMASVDSFVNKFAETFGFFIDRGDGTRDIFRDAGTQYDMEFALGEIIKSFGAQLNAGAKQSFSITDTSSVTEVMDKLSSINLQLAGYGWGMGYMWSNAFFNMEDGTVEGHSWDEGRHLKYGDQHWGHRWQHGDNRGWFSTQHPQVPSNNPVNYNLGKYSNDYYHETSDRTIPYGSSSPEEVQYGMYFGHKGFLRPDKPPVFSNEQAFWQSEAWRSTNGFDHADRDSGLILIPPGDHTDKCYPANGNGVYRFKVRDGYNTAQRADSDSCGVLGSGKTRGLHYRLGDRTYLSKKGSVHNFNIHINPMHQLYSFKGKGTDDVANSFLDDSTTNFHISNNEYSRRWTYYMEELNGKYGLRPFAHSMSQDIKGYERGTYTGLGYPFGGSIGNYWGMANVMLQFFIFGPLSSITPVYTGTSNSTENFFFKQ